MMCQVWIACVKPAAFRCLEITRGKRGTPVEACRECAKDMEVEADLRGNTLEVEPLPPPDAPGQGKLAL